MRHHALTDAAFAALGAGRPDLATIRELRRSQLGKHLLLLREIVRAVPGRTPSWYAGLAAAQHRNPAAIRRTLADPLFGAWAAHTFKAIQAGRPVGDLPRSSDTAPVLTAAHHGRTVRIRLEDSDRFGLTTTGRLSPAELAHWQDCLSEAWRILVTRHAPAADILAAVVDVVVPVQPDPAARGISATSADAFGAVAMSAPEDGRSLAVGLLHEAQHSILNATQYLFDLHQRPHQLGYSPWRDDPRPTSGILHGAYAYLAVTRFWRTEAGLDEPEPKKTRDAGTSKQHAPSVEGEQRREPHDAGAQTWGDQDNGGHDGGRRDSDRESAGPDRLARFEYARWRAAVAEVSGRLLEQGGLTRAGERFVGALHDEVIAWPEVGGPEQRLAEIANLDHRLRWRLRNLRVDPVTGGSRIVPAPRRALESSARLDLIHASLSGNPPGGRASAADVALLAGDHGTARRAYEEMVVKDPDDHAAWTGLAIATGRTDRLEAEFAARRRD